jgi:radical SAM protein with 4Fe4S-binding SPASM domain
MDRHIFNKLEFLEGNPRVEGFEFFTNFTIPKQKDIQRLVDFKKLNNVVISVYGHDLESFIAITKSTEKVYDRLCQNLETLLRILPKRPFKLEVAVRSTMRAPRNGPSKLMQIVRRFQRAGVDVSRSSGIYNNWGGYITEDDVKGLPISIGGREAVYKRGVCTLLLTTVQIRATGVVNGCSCRDVDTTLRIGDLNESLLRDIISSRNETYMRLIDEQQADQFRPVCQSCDFYQSIYHNRRSYRRNGLQTQSLAEFKAELDGGRGS